MMKGTFHQKSKIEKKVQTFAQFPEKGTEGNTESYDFMLSGKTTGWNSPESRNVRKGVQEKEDLLQWKEYSNVQEAFTIWAHGGKEEDDYGSNPGIGIIETGWKRRIARVNIKAGAYLNRRTRSNLHLIWVYHKENERNTCLEKTN